MPYTIDINTILFSFMRKIEQQMQTAIRNRTNWSSSNTAVSVDNEGNTFVMLHGNLIATIFNNGDMKLSSCGWDTPTTKSRLNAILDTFLHNVRVYQRNFQWWINEDKFFDGYQIIR